MLRIASRNFVASSVRRSFSEVAATSSSNDGESQLHADTEVASEEETQIAKKRDISRMHVWHRTLYHNQAPPMNIFKWQQERWALKERYAAYGRQSSVDPGVMWPTREELEEIEATEAELEPTLLQATNEARTLTQQKLNARAERWKDLEKRTREYPKVLEAYRKKLREKQEAIDEEKQIKEARIRDIQSVFGYSIETTDPRFLAMMEKKEAEEKKERAKDRKRLKEEETLKRAQEEMKALQRFGLAAQTTDAVADKDSETKNEAKQTAT